MIRIITLAALVAAIASGSAAAQDRSTPPASGAQKSTPTLNDSKGSSGNDDTQSLHGDENANPEAANKRGDIDENGAQALLQSKGYVDVRALTRDNDVFTATAHKDNQLVRVHVDARDGKITDMKLQ